MTQLSKSVIFLAALVACFVSESLLHGQPKPSYSGSSTHIFPAGGRRGTTVNVRVGTECMPPGSNFYIFGDGVKSPIAKLTERPPDTGEPAPRRLPGETPITYPREWVSRIVIAEDAPLGPAFWRVSCASGGTGSRPFLVGDFPEVIESESNSKPPLAERVPLPVTVNGRIHGERDVDYFRFTLSADEKVHVNVMAQRLGSRLDPVVELLDTNGRAVEFQLSHIGSDPQLTLTALRDGEYVLRISNVTFHGSPAHVYRIDLTKEEATNALSGAAEPEPNNEQTTAPRLAVPSEVRGSFSDSNDEDWFRFDAKQGEHIAIDCSAFPRGTAALPCLRIVDRDGIALASARAVEAPDRQCRLDWQATASGTFWLHARDLRYGVRGGEDFRYQLSLAPSSPDFAITAVTDVVNAVAGGKGSIDVKIDRRGGFKAPIDVLIDGLPDDVKLENNQIAAGASSAKLTFKVDEDVVPSDAALRIVCRAKVGEREIERVVQSQHLGVDSEGISVGLRTSERLHLTVQHKATFRLFCAEAYQYAHRGSIYPYQMEVERLDGFDRPITLQLGDRQNRDLDGIEMLQVNIPAGRSHTMLPIYLPESMHINVQSQSQLYSQGYATFKDKSGKTQAVLVLSEKRNMLRTLPPVVKLSPVTATLRAKPGGQATCKFKLARTSNFMGPMTLELLNPPGNLFSAPKFTIPAGAEKAAAAVSISRKAPFGTVTRLRFRATGNLTDDTKVVTEAAFRVIVE